VTGGGRVVPRCDNHRSDPVAADADSRTRQSVDERLQDIDPLSIGKLPLTEQAAVVVDETTDATGLVTQLEYDRYAHRDPMPDWHDAKPFEAIIGALLLQELEGASDGWLHRTLATDPPSLLISASIRMIRPLGIRFLFHGVRGPSVTAA